MFQSIKASRGGKLTPGDTDTTSSGTTTFAGAKAEFGKGPGVPSVVETEAEKEEREESEKRKKKHAEREQKQRITATDTPGDGIEGAAQRLIDKLLPPRPTLPSSQHQVINTPLPSSSALPTGTLPADSKASTYPEESMKASKGERKEKEA